MQRIDKQLIIILMLPQVLALVIDILEPAHSIHQLGHICPLQLADVFEQLLFNVYEY